MIKDFFGRILQKKSIHEINSLKNFYVWPKEIWNTSIGVNIGTEIDGKNEFLRPVLILKKVGSLYRVLPMTTRGKDNSIYYHKISSVNFGKPSYVILSQIRSIDKKRLHYRIATIEKNEFLIIKKSLIQWLAER